MEIGNIPKYLEILGMGMKFVGMGKPTIWLCHIAYVGKPIYLNCSYVLTGRFPTVSFVLIPACGKLAHFGL